jgi:hypothetical protein
MTLAPIAIGGLVTILFFRKAFASSASEAGLDIGLSASSIGSGIGTGLGTFGTGVGGLGKGIGEGISGLFKPIWELKNLADAFGLSSISKLSSVSTEGRAPIQSAIRSGSATQRVSGTARSTSGYTSTQQGSYVNKSGGVTSY